MSRLPDALGLGRRKDLRRKTPIKKRNVKRAKKRYQKAFGDKAKYIRSLPCCACGAAGPSDPHHVRSRGAGGTSADLAPLCRGCHREIHQIGVETFAAKWFLDLREKADKYEAWFHEDPQPLAF